jgi:hypothetical protein
MVNEINYDIIRSTRPRIPTTQTTNLKTKKKIVVNFGII